MRAEKLRAATRVANRLPMVERRKRNKALRPQLNALLIEMTSWLTEVDTDDPGTGATGG